MTPIPLPGSYDVLVIDGRSGSGKTTLADRVASAATAAGLSPQLLHVEDLYSGWDGLLHGSRSLEGALRSRRYRRYDWIAGGFGERVLIGPDRPLIIEGCGAISEENLASAHSVAGLGGRVHSVWLECPVTVRKPRAIERDGDVFAPHWERWAAQEDALYAVTRPWLLADSVLTDSALRQP